MLKDIFDKQEFLFEKIFGDKPAELCDEKKRKLMVDAILCAFEEIAEIRRAMNLTLFKKKTPNVDHAKEELIDLMHMVVQMALLLDIKPDEFHDIFVRKHNYNMTRVDHKSANKRTDI